MGTPDFSVPSLQALINDERFEIIGVVTQIDKKVGRKQILTAPPVKSLALKHGITVWQPEKISDLILPFAPSPLEGEGWGEVLDLIVVIAYAKIIPESILSIPKYGCINVHGSLLPKHRGASCIQGALLSGDEKTGITIMKMDKGLDTGPIISQHEITLRKDSTSDTVYAELSKLAAAALPDILAEYINGEIVPQAQDDSLASHTKLLKKEDGRIDFAKTAVEAERFIRAMHSWPGAFMMHDGKIIKIIKTGDATPSHKKPGTLFKTDARLFLQFADMALEISELQPEGKKVLSAKEFLNGYKLD